jgi:vacuolar-type H+-ATPase subunit H
MTSDEVYKLIEANGLTLHGDIEHFAALVASAEREAVQGRIDTLHAMYELASKQRDYLMDEQRAQVEAMRGRVQ